MKRRRKKVRKGFSNKKRLAVFGVSLAVMLTAFFVVLGMGGLFDFSGGLPGGEEYEEEITEPIDKETGKVNALIVGVDRGGDLTDTIMVASYDLDKNEINILSVPRDTRMYIGSKYQKINAAHAITKNGKKKGINGTIEAVTRLTGIPINYYVEFTFSAFRETIDALGGVDFDVPQNMNYDDPVQNLHIHLKKGPQHLDGEKAEQFVRFRRYPMGDIDRVAAQQSFIKALAEQKLNASIITKIPDIYKTLQKNLNTNITIAEVSKYLLNIKELSSENIHMHALPGAANGTDFGSSYWIADMTALAELVEGTFGYDASKITTHSADGSSRDKDVKVNQAPPAATSAPGQTAKPTAKPSAKPTATPKATKKPAATQKPTHAPTEKPAVSEKPTHAPTEKPAATHAPEKTAPPTVKPTEKPADSGIKRPAPNTGTEE